MALGMRHMAEQNASLLRQIEVAATNGAATLVARRKMSLIVKMLTWLYPRRRGTDRACRALSQARFVWQTLEVVLGLRFWFRALIDQLSAEIGRIHLNLLNQDRIDCEDVFSENDQIRQLPRFYRPLHALLTFGISSVVGICL